MNQTIILLYIQQSNIFVPKIEIGHNHKHDRSNIYFLFLVSIHFIICSVKCHFIFVTITTRNILCHKLNYSIFASVIDETSFL